MKAEEAAAAVGGFTLLPGFAVRDAGSDWNDLARSVGSDAARRQLQVAIAIVEREQRLVPAHAAEPSRDRQTQEAEADGIVSPPGARRTKTAVEELER
jgi:phage/plasmid primase-like uncharacterized protein